MLNKFAQGYLADSHNVICLDPSTSATFDERYIDFRDLFLTQADAIKAGASGTAPYGKILPRLKSFANDKLLSSDSENGRLPINDIILKSLVKSHSNATSMLQFDGNIFSYVSHENISEMNWIDVRASNFRIEHVDSVGKPLDIMKPHPSDAHVLDNVITLGTGSMKMRGVVSLLVSLEGDAMHLNNENIDISLEVQNAEVFAAIMAKVDKLAFLRFPLRDFMNPFCWLATIPTRGKNEIETHIGASLNVSAALAGLNFSAAELRLGVDCINCTSPGMKELPILLDILESIGTTSHIINKAILNTIELLEGDYLQNEVDQALIEAEMRCPHSPSFNKNVELSNFSMFNTPPSLTSKLSELFLFFGSLSVEVMTVVAAFDQLALKEDATNPSSGQDSLATLENIRLVNFYDPIGGFESFCGMVLDEINGILGATIADPNGHKVGIDRPDLGVNVLLRSTLLKEDTSHTINANVPIANGISLTSVRIDGLDTLIFFHALKPLANQTVQNQFTWASLKVEMVFAIEINTPTEHTFSNERFQSPSHNSSATRSQVNYIKVETTLEGVKATVDILLAIDEDKLGSLQLGSILHINQIIPCLLSTISAVDIAQLLLTVEAMDTPLITGFISSDIEESLARATDAIFNKYRSELVQYIPLAFRKMIRSTLSTMAHEYLADPNNIMCSDPFFTAVYEEKYIDFRDLLLTQVEASNAGANGRAPYGKLFSALKHHFNNKFLLVDPKTGIPQINELLVQPLTKEQSNTTGTLVLKSDFWGKTYSFGIPGLSGKAELRASNASFENIDSFASPLSFMQPRKANGHILENMATLGAQPKPIRAKTRLFFALDGIDLKIKNEVDLSIEVDEAEIFASIMAKVDQNAFSGFPLLDLMNPFCWLATIPAPAIDVYGLRVGGASSITASLADLNISITQLRLFIDCVDCDSPDIEELSTMLSSQEAISDTTRLANKLILDAVELLKGEFVQGRVDRMLNEAKKRCPHDPAYDQTYANLEYPPLNFSFSDRTDKIMFRVSIVLISILCMAMTASLLLKYCRKLSHARWLNTLPEEDIIKIHAEQIHVQNKENHLNVSTKAMACSNCVPLTVRVTMPFIILGNVMLFLSGHLNLAATLHAKVQIAGQYFTINDLFEFSMGKSIISIWVTDAKVMAIVIFVFSGVWPYTKQLITFILWFVPPSHVGIGRRGSILLWLDTFAKFSFVDILVLVISLAAFRVSLKSPALAFLPQDFYSVELMLIPLWGFYSNMIAQIISQISSHFIIHYHNKIVDSAIHVESQTADHTCLIDEVNIDNINPSCERDTIELQNYGFHESCEIGNLEHKNNDFRSQAADQTCFIDEVNIDNINPSCERDNIVLQNYAFHESCERGTLKHNKNDFREPLRKHVYKLAQSSEQQQHVKVRAWVSYGLLAHGILVVALFVLGCVEPSISIDLLGIIGAAVETGQDHAAIQHHSIFSLIQLIMDEARYLDTSGNYVGLGSLSALLVLTTFIAPLLQTASLLFTWYTPLTFKVRKRFMLLIRILQAWQYVEIFLVSIFIAIWNLSEAPSLIIKDFCGSLDDMVSSLVYYGILSSSDGQCFSFRAKVEGGVYVLLSASILLEVLTQFVKSAEKQLRGETMEEINVPKGHSITDLAGIQTVALKIKPGPLRFTDCFGCLLKTAYPTGDSDYSISCISDGSSFIVEADDIATAQDLYEK